MNSNSEVTSKRSKVITLDRILLCVILVLQLVILTGPRRSPVLETAKADDFLEKDTPSDTADLESLSDSVSSGAAAPPAVLPPPRVDDFNAVRNHMDALLARAMADFEQMDRFINFDEGWSSLMVSPTMDMRDETDEDEYVVVFSLPEHEESDITVSLDGRLLTVSCNSDVDTPYSSGFGSFVRSVWLPGPVGDREAAKAVMTNGVLRIVIPKGEQGDEAVRMRRIF